MSLMSMSDDSRAHFDRVTLLCGRDQLGTINFVLGTIYYAQKYASKSAHQVAGVAPLQMGLTDKLRATVDVGAFGIFWAMTWHAIDMDHPDRNMLGQQFKINE